MSWVCEPALRAHGPCKLCKSMSGVGRDVLPLCAETPSPDCKSSAGQRAVRPLNDSASRQPWLVFPSPRPALSGDAAGKERSVFHHPDGDPALWLLQDRCPWLLWWGAIPSAAVPGIVWVLCPPSPCPQCFSSWKFPRVKGGSP